jgi:hypothetical protein
MDLSLSLILSDYLISWQSINFKRFIECNLLIKIELIVSKTWKISILRTDLKTFHAIRIIIYQQLLTFKLI